MSVVIRIRQDLLDRLEAKYGRTRPRGNVVGKLLDDVVCNTDPERLERLECPNCKQITYAPTITLGSAAILGSTEYECSNCRCIGYI